MKLEIRKIETEQKVCGTCGGIPHYEMEFNHGHRKIYLCKNGLDTLESTIKDLRQ